MHCISQMPLSMSNHWIGNLVLKIESNYLWKVSAWHSSILWHVFNNWFYHFCHQWAYMLKFSIYLPHTWFYHVIPIYENKNNSEYSIHQMAFNPLNKYYWQMTNRIIPSTWSQKMEAKDKECHTNVHTWLNDYWYIHVS